MACAQTGSGKTVSTAAEKVPFVAYVMKSSEVYVWLQRGALGFLGLQIGPFLNLGFMFS